MNNRKQMEGWQACYIPNISTKVGRHARFVEIVERILSGWTSRQIEKWLTDQKAEPMLTCVDIENHIRTEIPPKLLTAELLMERLGTRASAEQINELGILQQICMAQLNRVARMVSDENTKESLSRALTTGDAEVVAQDTIYDKRIRPELEQLRKMLVSSAEMKFRLGILKEVPQELRVGQMGMPGMRGKGAGEDAGLTEREKERVGISLMRIVSQIEESPEDEDSS